MEKALLSAKANAITNQGLDESRLRVGAWCLLLLLRRACCLLCRCRCRCCGRAPDLHAAVTAAPAAFRCARGV